MPTLRESSPPVTSKGKSATWKRSNSTVASRKGNSMEPSTGNPMTSAALEQPPSSRSSGHLSPSPKKVMYDLIDATCHEILLLEGSDPESIAPYASYDVLAGRLDTYMKVLDVEREHESQGGGCVRVEDEKEKKSPDDIEAPSDNAPDKNAGMGAGLRCRLLMARLVMNVCMRSTYPNSTVDTNQSHPPNSSLPPLIQMTASEWEGLVYSLEKVKDLMHQSDRITGSQYQSLICQIEAMKALAKLRNHLHEAVTEIKQIGSASNYSNVRDNIDEYKESCDTIQKKLRDIRETRLSGLFISHQTISSAQWSAMEANSELISIVGDIDQMVNEQAFSLRSFQIRLLKILRIWAKSCLMSPTLFEVGYFGHHGDQFNPTVAASPSSPKSPGRTRRRRAAEAAPMMGGDCDRSSDSDFTVIAEDCDGDSNSDIEARKRPIKSKSLSGRANGQKRIRYTVQEKEALLDGVAKHGVGRWKVIQQEYHDIFEENGRTHVNLKDLYRTLTKKK